MAKRGEGERCDIDALIELILNERCLYKILAIERHSTTIQIRRAYLSLSKVWSCVYTRDSDVKQVHPDRSSHPQAKEAFQSLSTAYHTLTTGKQEYDHFGTKCDGSDHTLNELIRQVFREFMSGHFDSILAMFDQAQAMYPNIHIDPDKAKLALQSLREVCVYTEQCWDVAKFDVIKVFETQQQLCGLSYFDLAGRAKLSFAPVNDHEIMCAILVRMICFVEKCEKGVDESLRLVGWHR